ncbi:MAG: glycosyl transferase family 1 [Saprospiraceae bacterium]|nr:glycosyl transferase family 1 [Saprospiraceae bacterium]
MKKVLIITYYWPPSGGPGVQRCLYFVKYLREFGWEPIVYTVDKGEFPYYDYSLEKEIPDGIQILKHKAVEPFSIYKKLVGLKKEDKLKPNVVVEKSKRPLLHSIATWIRGNIFIPDARMLWIKPSVKFLSAYLSENKTDAILTSSPPHSLQLIGLELSKKFNIPWLVDLRDPWTRIFFADKLKMSAYAKKRNLEYEKNVLSQATSIVTVSQSCAEGFKEICGRLPYVITNGFDKVSESIIRNDDNIIIAYGGTLSGDRNPEKLWIEIKNYIDKNVSLKSKIKLQFFGAIDPAVYESIKSNKLGDYLETFDALSHDEYLKRMSLADILLLVGTKNDKGVITGKFFEYLAMKKPIISISPNDSDVEIILEQTQSGKNAGYEDVLKIKEIINWAIDICKNKETFQPNANEIEKYSRRILTKKLADLLDAFSDSKYN